MEVVSTLCFGHESFPEPELIEMLMNIIFNESTTRDLAPLFKSIKNDGTPTIRSSFLQLLLDCKYDKNHCICNCFIFNIFSPTDAKFHLDDYFRNCSRVMSQESNHFLCLLCIQCFEVS